MVMQIQGSKVFEWACLKMGVAFLVVWLESLLYLKNE